MWRNITHFTAERHQASPRRRLVVNLSAKGMRLEKATSVSIHGDKCRTNGKSANSPDLDPVAVSNRLHEEFLEWLVCGPRPVRSAPENRNIDTSAVGSRS